MQLTAVRTQQLPHNQQGTLLWRLLPLSLVLTLALCL